MAVVGERGSGDKFDDGGDARGVWSQGTPNHDAAVCLTLAESAAPQVDLRNWVPPTICEKGRELGLNHGLRGKYPTWRAVRLGHPRRLPRSRQCRQLRS